MKEKTGKSKEKSPGSWMSIPNRKMKSSCIHACHMDVDGDRNLDILIAVHSSSDIVYYKNPGISKTIPFPGKVSEWKGYSCHEFKLDGAACKIVIPKITAAGSNEMG